MVMTPQLFHQGDQVVIVAEGNGLHGRITGPFLVAELRDRTIVLNDGSLWGWTGLELDTAGWQEVRHLEQWSDVPENRRAHPLPGDKIQEPR